MGDLNRRTFLSKSSIGLAAAGLLASAPAAVPTLLAGAAREAPAIDEGIEDAGSLDGPLVAHVRDLATGEIGVYSGTQEIIIHNRGLAATLARVVR